jgi:uncharacterized sulfatase
VLWIISDDLNTRLGCYGDRIARTPNIDSLARRGMRFERAYCQSPICNPSRASFLSGLRPETTRVFHNQIAPDAKYRSLTTLPEYFHEHGYFSIRVGKVAHEKFEDSATWDVSESPGSSGRGRLEFRPLKWRALDNDGSKEPDHWIAQRALTHLEEHKEKRLFLAVGFRRPHEPFVAPRKFFDLYPLDSIPLWKGNANRSKLPAPA